MKYKKEHDAVFPLFEVFVDFIKDISKVKNDPGFNYEQDETALTGFLLRNRQVSQKTESM